MMTLHKKATRLTYFTRISDNKDASRERDFMRTSREINEIPRQLAEMARKYLIVYVTGALAFLVCVVGMIYYCLVSYEGKHKHRRWQNPQQNNEQTKRKAAGPFMIMTNIRENRRN